MLDEMEMITAFTDVLHIPNLHRGDQARFYYATHGKVTETKIDLSEILKSVLSRLKIMGDVLFVLQLRRN